MVREAISNSFDAGAKNIKIEIYIDKSRGEDELVIDIEGFWSLLKRGIGGVYHSVSEKYLQSYINEYGFRYNHRKDEKPMFLTVLERI